MNSLFGAKQNMKKVSIKYHHQAYLSYELYKELADEICSPISDEEMTLSLRFELYQSKLIYLYNINEQCFLAVNTHNEYKEFDYTQDDFINIQNSIEITREFLRQTIREALSLSIKSAEMKGIYASRVQKNC